MVDVLVIGSGGAGLTTAIEAKRAGANVKVISKTSPTSSQTSQAQGGINACINKNDKVENHINDTLKSAHGIGNKDVIEFMCRNGSKTIKWLENIAVPFSRDELDNIAQRQLGGAGFPRACYSSDYTGLKILHTLYDTCIKENIQILDDYMLLNIIVENGISKGITVLNIKTTEVEQILGKKVVLATGGYGGIYTKFNTNSYATTGDGIASALRAGCQLSNMEYIQFHPTSLKDSCILISESARGEGGYLVTLNGERFVDELKPRDEVARAIFSKIQDGEDIFLDLRHLGYEKIITTMPQEYDLALQYLGLRMDRDLIPIKPSAHYSMGGIKVDINGETNIKNLYAVGECANNGVHGANRLGGNSLLEIITFGRHIANNITKDLDVEIQKKEYNQYRIDKCEIEDIFKLENSINFYDIKEHLGELLYQDVGLFREESLLVEAKDIINKYISMLINMGVSDKSKVYNTNLKEFIEFKNMLEVSKVVIFSALQRKESRGAHFRVDYNFENEEFEKETLYKRVDDEN
jgi:succinate dehydrogenase / fumarate reductase flavoprotein subunit